MFFNFKKIAYFVPWESLKIDVRSKVKTQRTMITRRPFPHLTCRWRALPAWARTPIGQQNRKVWTLCKGLKMSFKDNDQFLKFK